MKMGLQISIISYRSTKIEFPILEYRPFRSFEVDQSSSLFLQIYGAVDIPHNVELLSATSTNNDTGTEKSLVSRRQIDI